MCVSRAEMKVASQNDKEKLALIKERVYNEGFYKGQMIVPEHKGVKVGACLPRTAFGIACVQA